MENPSAINHTVYKTNVPGKLAVLEPHKDNTNGKIFQRRTGGDTLSSTGMSKEELELRRAG